MMRNKIAYFMSAILLVVCGGFLSACTKDDTQSISTKDFVETIATMKADSDLFKSGKIDNLETEFVLKEIGEFGETFYSRCLGVALEYIDRNKDDVAKLDEMKLDKKCKSIKADLERKTATLYHQYQLLSIHNSKLGTFEEGDALDGMRGRYITLCRSFIEDSFDVALCVAEIEDRAFGNITAKQTSGEELTVADSNKIKDYLILYIAKDCSDLLVSNVADNYTSYKSFYSVSTANSVLQSAVNDFAAESTMTLTGELNENNIYENTILTNLIQLQEKQNVERKKLTQVLNDFSFKDALKDKNYDQKNENIDEEKYYLDTYFHSLTSLNGYFEKVFF